MPIEPPFDANAECRYCDEQGGHTAECFWLLALEQTAARLEVDLAAATDKVETLRDVAAAAQEDAARERLARTIVDEALRQVTAENKALRAKVDHYEQAHGLPDICCPD